MNYVESDIQVHSYTYFSPLKKGFGLLSHASQTGGYHIYLIREILENVFDTMIHVNMLQNVFDVGVASTQRTSF